MLIVLRHATPVPEGEDHARPLSPQGVAEAQAVARVLPTPTRVVSSTATRASQTARIVAEAFGLPVHAEPRLYLADAETIQEIVAEHPTRCLLLVGHNPGLERFLASRGAPMRLAPADWALLDGGRLVSSDKDPDHND